ncbi:hypothetical protein N8I71_18730 [Roseibacterium sp. SDUM158016]|uniref:hypothetical protein n=1 Tax=Roseicyclus sediminis TaxID=2980997 RepID=UPI0021CFCC5F|nr:hypothetical protein [Roseibacterium sp. SDUM158016]MCU4654878.1 hypothetical protein [Roseibacterium sp. SDUM158016]
MAVGADDFRKIENKLERCKKYLDELRDSQDVEYAALLWENILTAWCQSKKLFGKFCGLVGLVGIQEQIKADLSGSRASAHYFLHARNAEEHSFAAVMSQVPQSKAVHVPGVFGGTFVEGEHVFSHDNYVVVGDLVIRQPDYLINSRSYEDGTDLPPGASTHILKSYIVPSTVMDRGVEYSPPSLPVADEEWALALALDAVEWLDDLISLAVDELGWVR